MKKLQSKKFNFLNKFYFISFIFIWDVALSQNLISNPSFEIHSACPDGPMQLPLAIGWDAPTNNSVEYFNSCATNPTYSVPYQDIYNFQFARTGEAFIALYVINGLGLNYREYIRSQFINPLIQDNCYLVTFYVNATSGDFGGKYHTNNIGSVISSSQINSTGNDFLLNLEPDILKFGNPIITDTMNWTKIEGIYSAIGNENYITIGNFFDDTNTLMFDSQDGTYSGSSYTIDDVSVIAISDLPNSMPANAGPDIDLTLGDSVFIGQEISNLNCTWSVLDGAEIADSISGIYVQPTENTTYVVEQSLCGVTTYDTVTVFVHGVGLEESSPLPPSKGGIALSPNPNNGSFEIDLSKLNVPIQDLSIIDASGRIIYQEKNIASQNKLNIQTNLEKGVYFLRISSEKGMFEEKLIVQ